jgi:hypothetical protein
VKKCHEIAPEGRKNHSYAPPGLLLAPDRFLPMAGAMGYGLAPPRGSITVRHPRHAVAQRSGAAGFFKRRDSSSDERRKITHRHLVPHV